MKKDEIDYLADLYMAVEFGFIWGRTLYFIQNGFIDGEDRWPQFSLDDYIQYEKKKYEKALQKVPFDYIISTMFHDVIRYYQNPTKNNPDLQREIHKRIYNSIIDDLIQVQRDLAPEIREIYDSPRYVITPFKKVQR